MRKLINKQVEAQGAKKLDSFKGFETLNSKELQEIEGGWWQPALAIAGVVVYLYNNKEDFARGFTEGFKG